MDSCNCDKRAKAGGKACGNQSGNDNAVESSDYHNDSIAKAGGKARGNQSGNDNAVESSDYHNNSIPDHETHGSGRARKPPAKKCKCLLYVQIHLHCFQNNQIKYVWVFSAHQFNYICFQ